MAKIDIDILQKILERHDVDARLSARILEDVQEEIKIEKLETEEKEAPEKKKFVILASDPNGILEDKELVGWVVQIPEEESEYTAFDKIVAASMEFNRSKKGRRFPVEKVGDACQSIPAKFFKTQKIWIKNKEPAFLLPVKNALTDDAFTKDDE